MEQIIILFIEWFKQLSYLGIIIALTLEFIPAELVLPLVGYWVYQGDMHLILAIIAGTFGGTLGPLTLYVLGRYGGRPMIIKYGKFFLIKEKHIDAADTFFEKYGASVAFFARFIPGIRTAISVPCGMAKMNVWIFSLFTFLGMLPLTIIYIYLGYLFGPHWEQVGPLIKTYMLPLSLCVIILFLIYFFIKRHIEKNKVYIVKKSK